MAASKLATTSQIASSGMWRTVVGQGIAAASLVAAPQACEVGVVGPREPKTMTLAACRQPLPARLVETTIDWEVVGQGERKLNRSHIPTNSAKQSFATWASPPRLTSFEKVYRVSEALSRRTRWCAIGDDAESTWMQCIILRGITRLGWRN